MRRRHFLSLLPLAIAACTDNVVRPPAETVETGDITPSETPKLADPSSDEHARFAKSNNAFAFDLYKQVAKPNVNTAMSPFSISTAMTMTWIGARTDTESQMRKALHLDGPRERVLSDASKVNAWIQSGDKPFKLKGVNRLFGEKSVQFEQPFLAETKSAFGAPLAPMDFRTASEPARREINQWVEDQTEKRITELLPEGAVSSMTHLVLVNAIYFKADWANPFEQHHTRSGTFTTATGAKDVPTMNKRWRYPYAAQDGAKMIELVYKGDSMSMLLVVPDAVDGIAKLEASLTADKLEAMRAALKPSDILLSMPKFEVDPKETISLKDAFKALGMQNAFDPGSADFTGMSSSAKADGLHLSNVFHKAFVKVDEKGTEAAAATAAVPEVTSMPMPINIDRPFLFFIVDRASSTILFMGRVADPSSK